MQKPARAIVTLAIGASLTLSAAITFAESEIVTLGGAIYSDLNLSKNGNQACKTCHQKSAGFADQENRADPIMYPVSDGSDPLLFGGRNAPSSAYGGSSPVFYFDTEEQLFLGGMFWDGRATGWTLGDPLTEQALGPFTNPVEMALPDKAAVIAIIQASGYAEKFMKVFGPDAFIDVDTAYDNVGRAIAAFERSDNIMRYNSKFDQFWKEQGGNVETFGVNGDGAYTGLDAGFKSKYLTNQEAEGLALFNAVDKGNCAACHLTSNDGDNPPVFTDFSYDNLGIPVNPQIVVLAGPQKIDFGLGAMVSQLMSACGDASGFDCDAYFKGGCEQLPAELEAVCLGNNGLVGLPDGFDGNTTVYVSEAGKFKVPTLRNVARSAPYGHNGYFITLEDITNFYNTRDVFAWPAPEVSLNVNSDELGALGLTDVEVAAIVAFLKSLTD